MIGTDFDDMMQHRIQVTDMVGRDDFGKPVYDASTTRTYLCFISHDQSVGRTATETNVNETLIAYTKAIPENSNEPVTVPKESKVEILVPSGFPELPVTSVLTFYDDDGTDYCYEIRFGSGSIPKRG